MASIGARRRPQIQRVTPHSHRLRFLADLKKEQLLEEIERVWKILGRCPTREDLRRNSSFLNNKGVGGIIERRFGSWSKAIKAVCEAKGLPMPRIAGASIRVVSDQEPTRLLIEELQSIGAKLHNETMTYKNYKLHGGSYSISTFQHHFGSWENAIKEAGFTSGKIHAYSDDDLFDEMQRLWEQLGEQPTFDQMKVMGKISPNTYHKRFGSWTKAIHAFCDNRSNEVEIADEEKPKSKGLVAKVSSGKDNMTKAIRPKSTKSENIIGRILEMPPMPSISPHRISSHKAIVVRQTGRQVPPRLRFNVFQRDQFTCRACGRSPKEHGVTIEADHIIAYANGGETTFENLQTLCRDCNVGKSNQRPSS